MFFLNYDSYNIKNIFFGGTVSVKYLNALNLGLAGQGEIVRNASIAYLVAEAIKNGEGRLSDTGALVVETGKYTGRSPNDKFIVDAPSVHNEIAWGKINVPMDVETFDKLKSKVLTYLADKNFMYLMDLLVQIANILKNSELLMKKHIKIFLSISC
jgi:ATP-dependent phosphoenolpyruvate carboxykinase